MFTHPFPEVSGWDVYPFFEDAQPDSIKIATNAIRLDLAIGCYLQGIKIGGN
jgi:hypothetical protein